MLLEAGAFKTARAYIDGKWVDGGIKISDYRLSSYGEVSGDEGLAIPGFVDLQVNGHGGVDLLKAKDTEDIRKVSRSLFKSGVAAYLPTLITGPIANTLRVLALIEIVRKEPKVGEAEIIGTHLEGPFISHLKPGVHPIEHILQPDLKILGDFLRAGKISQVTIAPEISGAIDAIKFLSDSGVVVSLGHSNANSSQAIAGFEAGARTVTHLWNAMKKPNEGEPGLAQVALDRDDVIVQLIVDEVHLTKELVIESLTKCLKRFVVTVDSVSPAGLGDGTYSFGQMEINVKDNRPTRADGTLAGGVSSLRNSLSLLNSYQIPLSDAIDSMSSRAADLVGRSDLGRLNLGSPAQIWSI